MLFICLVVLASCSGKDIEKDAIKSMVSLTKQNARTEKDLSISNVKTIFKTDSCVVVTFDISGINGLGGYTKESRAYLYSICKFNIIGTHRLHSMFDTESDFEIEEKLWKDLKEHIRTSTDETIESNVLAYNVLFGKDVDSGERTLDILKDNASSFIEKKD